MVSLFIKMSRCIGIRVDRRIEYRPNVDQKPVTRSDMDNLSLGLDVNGGKMSVFIPSNTKIPKKKDKIFTTLADYQPDAYVGVYEGESELVAENVLLGELYLDGIPPAPKTLGRFMVCFDIDAFGTLRVTAQDTISSEAKKEITITSEQRRSAKMLNAKNTFRKYAEDIQKTLIDARYAGKVKAAEKRKIKKAANDAIIWLNKNDSAKVYEYKDKQKELEDLWNPIITKLYQDAEPPKVKIKTVSQEAEFGSVTSTPQAAFNLNEVD